MVYPVILSGIHTPLTGVNTLYFDCVIPMVLPFSFFGGPMPLLVSGGDLLTLRSLRALQEGSVLCYHLILESLNVLQLLLLLHNPLLFGLFLGFGLHLSLDLLSCMFYTMGLHCLLQTKEGLLLLLMPSLHFMALLLKYFSIVLRNIGEGGRRHDDTETRAKNFFFRLCIVNLGTITGFSDKPNRTLNKLNRTSKAQF